MKINNKQLKRNVLLHKRLLALSTSAFCTGLVLSSAVQASDIDIYQQAKAGDITLMMLLDISGSMKGASTARSDLGLSSSVCRNDYTGSTSPNYGYSRTYCVVSKSQYYTLSTSSNIGNKLLSVKIAESCSIQSNGDYYCGDRVARLKDAMYELLNGNVSKGIQQLDDDKIIGLATFGVSSRQTDVGAVLVPARKLGAVTAGQTQRQIITGAIQSIEGVTNTPTGPGYAEVINYMMGKRPAGSVTGFNLSDISTKTGSGNSQTYQAPESLLNQTTDNSQCSGQGIYVLTDGMPNIRPSYLQANMRSGLGNNSFSCAATSSNWDCQHRGARELVNKNNALKLEVRTALVGFGKEFEDVTSYDKSKTQAQNIEAIGCTLEGSCPSDQASAAYWGIIGGGGWYSGSSSKSVIDSVNSFLGNLGSTIPAMTTGAPTIPKDSLNPSVLLKNAFYPQFQPTPDKDYQLWAGNLKKYNVVGGVLKDKNGAAITDSAGKLVNNYDYWAKAVIESVKDADESTVGSIKFALMGGAKSQLELRTTADTENRKLLTNRMIDGTGSTAKFGNSTNLRQVKVSDLTTDYKYDVNRGYLISLLGYKIDPENPTPTTLVNANELRQVGAVMHSSPILITNKGKITYTNYQLGSSNREDYVLFGTTQGLLHVVDAETGKEKFAFVPNEMVENQKNAFLDYKNTETTGALNKLYYGVDGPWTTYTEYVADSNGSLTVGAGRNNQKGKQFAYGGLRMGGRSYYALDLSNINSPKLQFQIAPADKKIYYNGSSNSIEALKYMGQSWSKPTIAWVNWGKKRKRVMFVGGGYDAGGIDGDAHNTAGVKEAYSGYENDTYNQTSKIGGGVYMFDADNGNLLWWGSANATTAQGASTFTNAPNLKYSVVSEIRTEDRDNDGLADHLYFGDLGGQVFRIDLDNNAGSNTALVKTPRLLLNLNSSTAGASPRFYEMPAFSTYKQTGQNFAVISIGSGNRSLPLKDYTVGTTGYDYDIVYNIYDKDVVAENLFKSGYTYLTNTSTLANLNEITQANRLDDTTIVAPFTTNGWYYRFKSNKLQSAKVFSTPIVLNYRMFVSIFDSSKDGLSGDCGAGVKGESFLQQFCMPFGQCPKSTNIECATGDGCSIGPGLRTSTIVNPDPDPENCDPAKEDCAVKNNPNPKPDDGSNNKNYCISTGDRGVLVKDGIISAGGSKMCLIPQRWYELSR